MNAKKASFLVFGAGAVFGCLLASSGGLPEPYTHASTSAPQGAGRASLMEPNGTVANRYVYYPGTGDVEEAAFKTFREKNGLK